MLILLYFISFKLFSNCFCVLILLHYLIVNPPPSKFHKILKKVFKFCKNFMEFLDIAKRNASTCISTCNANCNADGMKMNVG